MPAGKVTEFGGQAPIGRPAQPAETAPAHVFPASQEADCTIGEVVNATGGTPLPQRLRHGGAARGRPTAHRAGTGRRSAGGLLGWGEAGPSVARPARHRVRAAGCTCRGAAPGDG